jgi:predicted phage terminase large subunit-like protein
MLTLDDIDQRLAALPSHLRAVGEAYRAKAYAHVPRPHHRSAADQKIYDNCRWNLALFARTFFPHICSNSFNQVHLDFYQRYADIQGSRGHRDCTAAPRGASKTSGLATMGILHACAYETEDYILYLTNSADNATLKVKDMRDELTDNDEFIRVYGPQESAIWNQGWFVTLGGVGVAAAGRGSQLRGKTKRFKRFTWIVVDDLEHPEHVLSELQREKTHNFLHNDVFKLGQPSTNITVYGTILHPASELAQLLETPGWHRHFYQSVIQFADPASVPLWQEWRNLFIDIGNPRHQEDAEVFFDDHQEAMLAGTEVLWPDRTSYYDLMVERIVEGETSFWCERQNAPMGDTRFLFDLDQASYCTLRPEGIVRADGTYIPFLAIQEICAWWDPTPDKRDARGTDYASCPVVMKDRDGFIYCIDGYLAQEVSTSKQIAAIVDLLWYWQVPLLGIESNNFASLLVQDMREAIAQRAAAEGVQWEVGLIPVVNSQSKILRIKTLEPMIHNGWLQLARTLSPHAFQQLAEFLPVEGASHDDFPDSLEGACRVIRGLYDRRSAY